ncbi:MAG: hypothetical protein AB8G05_00960 [Oligoflexales bacterium]
MFSVCIRANYFIAFFVFNGFICPGPGKLLGRQLSNLVIDKPNFCSEIDTASSEDALRVFLTSIFNSDGKRHSVSKHQILLHLETHVNCVIEGVGLINSRLGIPPVGDSLSPLVLRMHSLVRDIFFRVSKLPLNSKNPIGILEKLRMLWLEQERVYKWPAQVGEYWQLLEILLEDSSSDKDHEKLIKQQIYDWNAAINVIIDFLHPKLHLSQSKNLRANYNGKDVGIVVFDLFDSELLKKQRRHYDGARILDLKTFGNPVSLSHGNAVIDVILTLAPQATIIPIAASNSHAIEAFKYIAFVDGYQVVNISRPFIGQGGKVNRQFARFLSFIGESAIISKAMGNSGTDINGILSPRRQRLGLGKPGDLSAYDTALIRDYVKSWEEAPKVFFTINAELSGQEAALTATVPGSFEAIYTHSLALNGEGLFSWANVVFESGSSFAAPQLSAFAALLFEVIARDPYIHFTKKNATNIVYTTLREAALQGTQDSGSLGLGFLKGDAALEYLRVNNFE